MEDKNKQENVVEIKNLTKSYKLYNSKMAKLLEAVIPKYKNHTEFNALNELNLEIKSPKHYILKGMS